MATSSTTLHDPDAMPGVRVFTEYATNALKSSKTWARLTWRKRMTQWLNGDGRREFYELRPTTTGDVAAMRRYFGLLPRSSLGGADYRFPISNMYKRVLYGASHHIWAETLSQWGR